MNITLNKKRGRPPKPVAQTSPKPERLEIKLSILKAAIQASPDIHREDVRKAILTIVDEAARLTPEKRFLFLQFNTNAARRLERKIVREICAMNDKSSKTNLLEVSNEAGVYVVAGRK
ncbi:MAG: hypothetical protein L6Q57_07695 [Alphaproteobacteria bacterium]|nr:hypothetical protein [Alphaproteobacteria bacterium]